MQEQPKHPWIARLSVCLVMLVLAFVGLIFTNIHNEGGWDYWRLVVPLYAILALWLSWYLRRKQASFSAVTLWHELLHWIGLIASAFVVSCLLQMGILSRFLAGLTVLILIAQAVFLAGIYIERTFLFIGVILALFAWAIAYTFAHLYFYIAVPILILILIGVVLHLWHSQKKSAKPPESSSHSHSNREPT